MNEAQAKNLVKETFEQPFDKESFVQFIREMLNEIEVSHFSYHGNYIPDKFKQYISTYERIGRYKPDDNKRIDILVVHLQKNTSLERARTMQRNFTAGYLNGNYGSASYKDAALVAFVSPNNEDWRFSLVKLDYTFDAEKSKIIEKFTPARRWSFLVGPNEGSHTAQSRLYPLILDDEHNPTLEQIEQAFDIETVTKEFFLKYRELFIRTKMELDKVLQNDPDVRAEFNDKNINTVDFAKKLLGQIVFLYFLQKKGWFGVPRNAKWGEGSKRFLRELFDKKHIEYDNFFNDALEPLFYDALAIDHSHIEHWSEHFHSRIPFLNGGLFDPIGGYRWDKIDINLPDTLFSNDNITKDGDIGDGILDIFDRFNFTVNEDEPLEKEVAIDPEMLGKIFEKLGAITSEKYDEWAEAVRSGNKHKELQANKKLGVYYTPREIVHYMCQQSLINYIDTVLSKDNVHIPKEDIEKFIRHGEHFVENEEEMARRGGRETNTYSYKIPEKIRENARRIDNALAEIRICDPAIGSGAFPIGMMTEIVKIRDLLSQYLPEDKNRTHYNFKRECIENSLYGVDIDRGAVEIAKLRFWLSLIVDEDNFKDIKPLPNLDYKIVCGNSLLGVERDIWNYKQFQMLERLKSQFFNETNATKKNELKNRIDALIHEITDGKKIFDFRIYFSEVFHEKNGFDIAIGNPPYIQLQKAFDEKQKFADLYKKENFKTFKRTGDIYALFYEKGIDILNENGILCYITSNKWMRAAYGKPLRKFLSDHNPLKLIDLGPGIFEMATVDTNILLVKKQKQNVKDNARKDESKNLQAITLTSDRHLDELTDEDFVVLTELSEDSWIILSPQEYSIKQKIERIGTPLKDWDVNIYYGIKTGYNEAFIISTEKRNEILANCQTEDERIRTEGIIKPILRGRDIKRYYYDWADLWVIFIPWHFPLHNDSSIQGASEKAEKEFEKQYPIVYRHLYKYKNKLSSRNKDETGIRYEWYALQRCAATYYKEFEKEKVVWQELAQGSQFSMDTEGDFFVSNTGYILTGGKLKYIVGFLNSKLNEYIFNRWIGSKIGKNGIRWLNQYITKIPIPLVTDENKDIVLAIESLVDVILSSKKSDPQADTTSEERQIDHLVYKLYGLTDDEIRVIEGQ